MVAHPPIAVFRTFSREERNARGGNALGFSIRPSARRLLRVLTESSVRVVPFTTGSYCVSVCKQASTLEINAGQGSVYTGPSRDVSYTRDVVRPARRRYYA